MSSNFQYPFYCCLIFYKMTHHSRYQSYAEMSRCGLFSSESNCLQYLLDVGILPTERRCITCSGWMNIVECSETLYSERCCWKCCNNTVSMRTGSILQGRRMKYRLFNDILYEFSRGSTVRVISVETGVSQPTVRSLVNDIKEQIAAEVATHDKIGGPGKVVEIDESKFGKQKYNRGRVVPGSWVLGGVERNSKRCFLDVCPNNSRSEATLVPLIREHVALGTTIITDKWKAYCNLDNHGYVHLDVNHSENFVDPGTGAHTNSIEGTWNHVKNRSQRTGGRRTVENLAADLTSFMWLRQKDLLSSQHRVKMMFARELPLLLNFKNF